MPGGSSDEPCCDRNFCAGGRDRAVSPEGGYVPENDARNAVLVGGAINTDLVARTTRAPEAGETVTGSDFNVFGGGKGANQTVASARSGARTVILGAVGQDDFGRQRLADLQREGVDVAAVTIDASMASGVALIAVEESGENRILYVPGATLTVTPEQAATAFDQVRPDVVLTTLELPIPTLERLYKAAREAGAVTMLNATPEPENGRTLVPLADVLVVNESEAVSLSEHSDGSPNWVDVAEALAALGPRCVVVTLGAAGAVVRDGQRMERIAAPPVEVVDTTGAGDAFCGAMAARLAEGVDPIEAARVGVAAGSLAVTKAGAQPSMPHREEIDRLVETTR